MSTSKTNPTEVIDLSAYDDEFRRASIQRAAEDPLDELPDGFYDTRVEDVHLNRTTNTGNPMLIWRLRITGPTAAGRSITKVRVITPKTLAYVKEDLQRLGVEIELLSELPQFMDQMLDREVPVYKRTNPDRRWTEVYFIRRRKGPASESPAAEAAWRTGTDDDLPF